MPTHFSAATGAIKRLIAVVDETGSNRPQENEQAGFGVGAILFADTLISHVVEIAQRIADVVKKEDFKYKHVQGSGEARQLFLAMFNNREKPVRCYGFFTPGACVAKELHLTKEAGRTYAGAPPPDLERQKTEVLLRSFIYSMAPQIAAYASANGYFVDMCWDRRTDIAALKTCWEEIINEMEDGSEENVRFVGAASGELTWVSRLAGVLAGDVRQYFIRHGQRIWPRMDASGLRGNVDPYSVPELSNTLMPIVATINERLADPEPEIGSEDTVMLQGYYKAFLEDRSDGDRLISFGDPDGHLGILRITRGDLWHIRQLPD